MVEEKEPAMTLDELVSAAQDEQWEVVDQSIPELADNPDIIKWVVSQGFINEDFNLRDLAASIIEQTNQKLNEGEIDNLTKLAFTDPIPHVQYRSAFALYRQGIKTQAVMS